MARISRFKLNDSTLEKLFNLFFEVVGNNQSKTEFISVIHELLSKTERIMIAKRIAIIFLLMKGIDQQSISRSVKVSNNTICKYAGLMDNYRTITKNLHKTIAKDKTKIIISELMLSLFGPGSYGHNWKAGRRLQYELSRLKQEGL